MSTYQLRWLFFTYSVDIRFKRKMKEKRQKLQHNVIMQIIYLLSIEYKVNVYLWIRIS